METSCQKCGTAVAADQAFCPKCGAVVGMGDAGAEQGGDWNLAATMVGRKLKPTPRPSPQPSAAAAQPARPSAPAPAADVAPPSAPTPARGTSATLLAVIAFVVVLVIGALLIFLFYLNSRG